jgi:hypothetical protein
MAKGETQACLIAAVVLLASIGPIVATDAPSHKYSADGPCEHTTVLTVINLPKESNCLKCILPLNIKVPTKSAHPNCKPKFPAIFMFPAFTVSL